MKALAENIWWLHLYREVYHRGKSCAQCIKAGENFKVNLGWANTQELPDLPEANEETNLDFAGQLDKNWGTSNIYFYV